MKILEVHWDLHLPVRQTWPQLFNVKSPRSSFWEHSNVHFGNNGWNPPRFFVPPGTTVQLIAWSSNIEDVMNSFYLDTDFLHLCFCDLPALLSLKDMRRWRKKDVNLAPYSYLVTIEELTWRISHHKRCPAVEKHLKCSLWWEWGLHKSLFESLYETLCCSISSWMVGCTCEVNDAPFPTPCLNLLWREWCSIVWDNCVPVHKMGKVLLQQVCGGFFWCRGIGVDTRILGIGHYQYQLISWFWENRLHDPHEFGSMVSSMCDLQA